jgi:hypothetical protein
MQATYGDGRPAPGFYDHECTWNKCSQKQIVAQVAYNYVTGRGGRVTDARKRVCQAHLDQFLKTNPTATESEPVAYENWDKYF